MWCYDRRRLLGLVAAWLSAGCTVRPLYVQTGGETGAARPAVALGPLPGRNGYVFREAIARRFSIDPTARHQLDVTLDLTQSGLALTELGDVTRYNVIGTASFVLVDRQGNRAVLQGTVRSISGYSALASAFATRVAREDTEARVLGDLAERVFTEVAVRGALSA